MSPSESRGFFALWFAAIWYATSSVKCALLNTLSSFLLVVSYLWGGCVSCEQFFMLPGSKGHCCETRRCKNPVKKSTDRSGPQTTQQDCQTMPLEGSSVANSHSDLAAPLPDLAVPAAIIIDFTHSEARVVTEFDFTAGSPPDIPLTNSALLI